MFDDPSSFEDLVFTVGLVYRAGIAKCFQFYSLPSVFSLH